MLKHCPWFPSLRSPGVMSSVPPFFSCHPWGLHLFGGLNGFLSLGHRWLGSFNSGSGVGLATSDTCDLVPGFVVPKKSMGRAANWTKKNGWLGSNFWIDDPLFWAISKHILLSVQRVKNHLGRFDGFHDHPWPSMTCCFKVASSRISPTSEQISSTPEVAWWNDHCSAMS